MERSSSIRMKTFSNNCFQDHVTGLYVGLLVSNHTIDTTIAGSIITEGYEVYKLTANQRSVFL